MLRTLHDFEQCVISATDGHIGRVKDLYFDDHAWAIRYLVVDTGSWLAGRKVLISPISIQQPDWARHALPVAITKEQVEHSPDIDTDQPVSRRQEERYLGYYGYPNYWGGYGIWGAGMFPTGMYPGYGGLSVAQAQRQKTIAQEAKAEPDQPQHGDPRLRSCKAVMGYHIGAIDGEVGHVDALLIDEETWAVRYLVVNTGHWWLGHKVLIAPQWITGIHWSDQTVTVDLTREKVKTAPPYDPSVELGRQSESDLYAHHVRAPYWTVGSAPERKD